MRTDYADCIHGRAADRIAGFPAKVFSWPIPTPMTLTMSKQILLIQGHPDSSQPHLAHALASSYRAGAEGAGHPVRQINVAELVFPLLRGQHAWKKGAVPASLEPTQADIAWAQHIVLFSPPVVGRHAGIAQGFSETGGAIRLCIHA